MKGDESEAQSRADAANAADTAASAADIAEHAAAGQRQRQRDSHSQRPHDRKQPSWVETMRARTASDRTIRTDRMYRDDGRMKTTFRHGEGANMRKTVNHIPAENAIPYDKS